MGYNTVHDSTHHGARKGRADFGVRKLPVGRVPLTEVYPDSLWTKYTVAGKHELSHWSFKLANSFIESHTWIADLHNGISSTLPNYRARTRFLPRVFWHRTSLMDASGILVQHHIISFCVSCSRLLLEIVRPTHLPSILPHC